MHTGALKKWALALTFWLALHLSPLKAQIFTNDLPLQAVTTGSNPVDFEFRSNGILIAKGNYGVGSLVSGDEGAGTRMLWFPSLGAFRVGGVSWTQWDPSNIGAYSTASGYDTTASGEGSTAMGSSSTASGSYSTAFGCATTASGEGSTTTGAYNTASGWNATAMGTSSTASGSVSTAMGSLTLASGSNSTSMGEYTTASGYYATAMGYSTTASGSCSTASGIYTTAAACFDFVVGVYNVGGGSEFAWVDTDPLFEVGNGGGSSSYGNPAFTEPADAFVVYKNGNAALQGTLQVAPGGNIPMYTGE